MAVYNREGEKRRATSGARGDVEAILRSGETRARKSGTPKPCAAERTRCFRRFISWPLGFDEVRQCGRVGGERTTLS